MIIRIFVITFMLISCAAQTPATPSPTPASQFKAVYLVRDAGEISAAELKQHPEIAVVGSMAALQTTVTHHDDHSG